MNPTEIRSDRTPPTLNRLVKELKEAGRKLSPEQQLHPLRRNDYLGNLTATQCCENGGVLGRHSPPDVFIKSNYHKLLTAIINFIMFFSLSIYILELETCNTYKL